MKGEQLIKNQFKIHFGIIFLAVALIYSMSLSFGFVWDDVHYLVGNEVYKSFDVWGILSGKASEFEYFPVRDFSQALDYLIWGENPLGFHLVNVMLFCLNAVFIYFTALEVSKLLLPVNTGTSKEIVSHIPFLTTLLFVVHPLNTEVVSWVICRAVILSGLFFFMSSYFFLVFLRRLQHPEERITKNQTEKSRNLSSLPFKKPFFVSPMLFYIISILAFIFSILSKQYSIILPGILFLFVLVSGKRLLIKTLYLIPFIGITAFGVYLFKAVASNAGAIIVNQTNTFNSPSLINKIAVAIQIPFFYIQKLFIPINLSAIYAEKFSDDVAEPVVLFTLFAFMVITVVVFLLRKKHPVFYLSFGLYIVALFPFFHFFNTSTIVADRYAYIASFGIFYLFAFLFTKYLYHSSFKKISGAIMVIALITLAITSFQRSSIWKSEETLWLNTINDSPKSSKACYNIADYYFTSGEFDKAFKLLENHSKIIESDIILLIFKGRYLFLKNDFNGAIKAYEKIINKRACPIEAKYMLARSYEIIGNNKKALLLYSKTIKYKGLDDRDYKEKASKRIKTLQALTSLSIEPLRKAVKEHPTDLNTHAKLGIALEENLMYNEAALVYEKILSLGGANWGLYFNLGNVYKKMGNYKLAVTNYNKSIELNNQYPDTYNNLGLVLKELHDYDGAIKATKDAMALDPNFKEAPFNLATLYFIIGEKDNALKYFNHVLERFPELKDDVAGYMKELK